MITCAIVKASATSLVSALVKASATSLVSALVKASATSLVSALVKASATSLVSALVKASATSLVSDELCSYQASVASSRDLRKLPCTLFRKSSSNAREVFPSKLLLLLMYSNVFSDGIKHTW